MKNRPVALIPFVPSGPDFSLARSFFAELGFETIWEDDGLAGLRSGDVSFILQAIDVPEWQSNQMITLEVPDLETFWTELSTKGLVDRYDGVKLREPTDFPWGREVHFVDPAGVCWHVRQRET